MSAVGGSRRAKSKGIFRIRIVVNKLREVSKDIEFYKRLGLRRHCRDILAVFTVRLFRFSSTAADLKCVFPLFGETFRIDVRVPNHECTDEWIRHLTGC